MALLKCRECGKEVSSEAGKCPHCGLPSPGVKEDVQTVATGIILAAIFYFMAKAFKDEIGTDLTGGQTLIEYFRNVLIFVFVIWGAVKAGQFLEKRLQKKNMQNISIIFTVVSVVVLLILVVVYLKMG